MTTPVRSSSDSKVAIKRCLKANIHETLPQVWSTSSAQRELETLPQVWSTSSAQRELLQLSWTKGHLDATQHCQRFGLENWWMWATNLEADLACSRKSAEVFSHQQANRTACIDQAARAKFFLLGQRCAHILAHDPVPRFKEAKFEAAPVAGRQAKPSGPNKRQRLLAASQGATKSTGSVSRCKARALAHRAAIDSKVIPGEAIGAPVILPPPPPKAPTQEPVVLREAQPMSDGKSPHYNGPSVPVVLNEAAQAKGERPPQDCGRHGPQYTEVIPTTSGETSPQGLTKKQPKAPESEGECTEKTRSKRGEVLPKDKRALEASSSDHSTESDEGREILASSSTTPWQRRVRLRTALEAKRKN